MGKEDRENATRNPRNTTSNGRSGSGSGNSSGSINRNNPSSTQVLVEQLGAPTNNGSRKPIQVNPYDYSKESLSEEAKVGPYGGRSVIDDDQYQSLLSLGYDDATLRQKFFPKSEKKLADDFGEMYWNSPLYAKPKKSAMDEGARTLIMQSVLAPYLQKTGEQFNSSRAGIQQTQNSLLEQMDPRYRPYIQAMNNNSYMAQDQSWLDSINAMAVTPLLEQLNAQLAAAAQQGTQTDEDAFLASLGMTGLGG